MTAPAMLENGWTRQTPEGDSVLRRFVLNQSDVAVAVAQATGGRVERTDAVTVGHAGAPVPYLNQAVLQRPLDGPDDRALDEIDAVMRSAGQPSTVLSVWPTPDLRSRGWVLVGHPTFMVRSPGAVAHESPADVEVRVVADLHEVVVAEQVAVDGYPMPEARDARPGSLLGAALDGPVLVRLGLLGGEPVAVGASAVSRGVVNLCLAATLPAARRRGVWASLVWARVADAPTLPAVAFTSDDSRPGFERMGFIPVTRFTLWLCP